MFQKRFLFLIGFALLLLGIVLFFLYALFVNTAPSSSPSPTPSVAITTPSIIPPRVPPASLQTYTNPPVSYQQGSIDKIDQVMSQRKPLTSADLAVRQSLMHALSGQSGVLYQGAKYKILYVKAPDIFEAELLSTDLAKAKQEATTWFTQKGFSQDGICHLPILYYLNSQVADKLRGTNTQFYPLPDGC